MNCRINKKLITHLVLLSAIPTLVLAAPGDCDNFLEQKGQYIEGRFYSLAEANMAHDNARHNMSIILRPYEVSSTQNDGWIFKIAPHLYYGGNNEVVPDIAGWMMRDGLSGAERKGDLPDWICEVISLSSGAEDLVDKMRLYTQLGIKYYWVVDPIAQLLEIYGLDDAGSRVLVKALSCLLENFVDHCVSRISSI
jgi:Uma2 family endonuclease